MAPASISAPAKLSYETDLYVTARSLQLVQADGTRLIFNRDPNHPSLCASPNPAHGKVTIAKTARGDEYTWVWTDGRQLSFNSSGKLVQILAPTGEFIALQHETVGITTRSTLISQRGRSICLTRINTAKVKARKTGTRAYATKREIV